MLREASSKFSRISSMLNTEEGIPLKLPDKLSKLVPAHTSFKTKGRKLGGDIHGVAIVQAGRHQGRVLYNAYLYKQRRHPALWCIHRSS